MTTATTAMTSRLHAALIWGGEPIADVVLDKPGPITIGPVAGATFTVPDLGLPEVFPIVRPGETGYIVQLGQDMGGTMSLGGVRTEVGALVGDQEFAAAAIRPGDWGVVDLDGGGGLQLFFQVAPAPERIATKRSWDVETVMPAVAFSVLLHLFLLIASYTVTSTRSPFTFPPSRSLAIQYIATRLPPPPQIVPVVAPPAPNDEDEDHGEAPPAPDKKQDPRKGREDAGDRDSGGPDDQNADPESDPEPGVGVLDPRNRELLRTLHRPDADIQKFLKRKKPLRVGQRPGGLSGTDELPGSPRGDGDGPAFTEHDGDGDGNGDGKCKKGDKKCTKYGRGPRVPDTKVADLPGEIEVVRPDDITVDDDTVDRNAIARAIASRKGVFKACFQSSLDRRGGTDGEVVVVFTLAPTGQVTNAKVERGTGADATLKACVQRNIMSITKFPRSRDGAVVRYPFRFRGGG